MDQTMKRKLDNETIITEGINKKPKTEQEGTKLEDLKDECLINIFKHFAIKDLVNVVRYNERFLIPARDIFLTKFSNNLVDINHEVKTPVEAAHLLKHFGSEIKKLEINYHYSAWNARERRLIDYSIIKYCQNTLVEIKFGFPDDKTMTDLKTPFEKVEKVCFSAASCIPLITDFGHWFPNAETLELEDMYVSRCSTMKHMPKLKNLIVCNTYKMSNIEDNYAQEIIAKNPQLTTLSNTVIINRDDYILAELVHDAKDDWLRPKTVWLNLQLERCLPHLKSLHLLIPREKGVGFLKRFRRHHDASETPDKFQFDELTDLFIDFEESTVLKGLPIFTKKLEKLTIHGSHLDNNCLQFIRNNQTPNCIDLMGKLKSNNLTENLIKLLSKLPQLNELHFEYSWNNQPSHVIALLKKCKHLRKLAVRFECGSNDGKGIESAFNTASGFNKSEWKTTYAANETKYDFDRYEKRFSSHLIFEKSAPEA